MVGKLLLGQEQRESKVQGYAIRRFNKVALTS